MGSVITALAYDAEHKKKGPLEETGGASSDPILSNSNWSIDNHAESLSKPAVGTKTLNKMKAARKSAYASWFSDGTALRSICNHNQLSRHDRLAVALALETENPAIALLEISMLSKESVSMICYVCGFGRVGSN